MSKPKSVKTFVPFEDFIRGKCWVVNKSANSLSSQSLTLSTLEFTHFNLYNFLVQVPETFVPKPALDISR